MKFEPVIKEVKIFEDLRPELHPVKTEDLYMCCDSVVAVLTQEQIEEWLPLFKDIVDDDSAPSFCAYHSSTLVFDIDGSLLVVVSDAGGELASSEFTTFCEERSIESQFIIDSLDCTDVEVEDIYTGMVGPDNLYLLGLVHKLYN